MKIIEFFGIPGSGKTFLKEKLLLEFDKRNYKVYSYKKILEKFLSANEKNIFKYILLKFFFIFRYKNFKKKSIKKFSKKKFHKKESFLLNFKKYFYKIYEKNIN